MKAIHARTFANELTELCSKHGLMIWTAYETCPMMITEVGDDSPFTYVIQPYDTHTFVIRRVLEK